MRRLTGRVGAGSQGLQIAFTALIGWIALLVAVPALGAGAGDIAYPAGGIAVPPAGAGDIAYPAGGATTPNLTDGRNSAPRVAAAPARDWTISVRAAGALTLTDNVSLAPPGQEKGDVVLGLALPLGLRHESAHVKLVADYTPTFYEYARSRDANNLQNNLHSLMTLQAVDNFFFVDAIANMDQSYILPSAPRPVSGSNITSNRTTQTVLGLSPYIRHASISGWSYLVRDDNLWNSYGRTQVDGVELANSVSNRLSADAISPPARLRYGFDYTYLHTRDDSQPTAYYEQVARVRPILAVTPRLNVSARLGYESNDYATSYSGPVYGAGVGWAPDPRTNLDGFVEHRFFGAAYGLNFNHRTRLTAWKLSATNNVYTAVDQSFNLQPITTAQILGDALRSQLADPVQREQAVQQLMESAGLPTALTQPYSFYTNQVYQAQQLTGSVGLVGKRNTAALTFFMQYDQPITTGGNVLPAGFVAFTPFRQRGVRMAFSHRLTGFSSVSLAADRIYATQDLGLTSTPQSQSTQSIQNTVRLALTHQLSPHTDASIGVRWANFEADIGPYREQAVIAVLGHSF